MALARTFRASLTDEKCSAPVRVPSLDVHEGSESDPGFLVSAT